MSTNFLCTSTGAVSPTEAQEVSRFVNLHRDLIGDADGQYVDTAKVCFNSVARFLKGLEQVAETMQLQPAARTYRQEFTANYRALLPDEARNYRVEILEASFKQQAETWVNREKMTFSEEAMSLAGKLKDSWEMLGKVLDRWHASKQQRDASILPSRGELKSAFRGIDVNWAAFEQTYISELIAFERRAKQLLVDAVESEKRLHELEQTYYGETEASRALDDYESEQRYLLVCIARLNLVANVNAKGRDDFSVEVLQDAVRTLQGCMRAEEKGQSGNYMDAAKMLSTEVVEAFVSMRLYLWRISSALDQADPHLCNNIGLVEKLIDFEGAWEVGALYLKSSQLLTGLCDLVSEIRCALRNSSAFMEMCQNLDAEWFLVLPRFILLRMLYMQELQKGAIMSLLPHRFEDVTKNGTSGQIWNCDEVLNDLVKQFQATFAAILDAQRTTANGLPVPTAAAEAAWEVLTKRVVNGSEQDRDDTYGCLDPVLRSTVEAKIESFLTDLEPISMELQRQCPEDWNSFSQTVYRCIQGEGEKKNADLSEPFQI
eukprot:TRINITY_DN12483_c0_g1_i2.p1 TRINITY_DN12483_c0_g1~~TRINITY_DN12483_c0_g1_i2.p1  ORF type:complete len:545 (+),score=87.39 TRINITY_DN12483_c0_g1_i2:99-1733(+)